MDSDSTLPQINNAIAQNAQDSQYTVSPIPYHTHNGSDSPVITTISLPVGTPVKLGFGGMISTSNAAQITPGTSGESIQVSIDAGKDQLGTLGTTSNNLQLNLLHFPQNAQNHSFINAVRPPLYEFIPGTTISTTMGGNTVTISGYTFVANSLANAIINIIDSSGNLIETQLIASNTSTVVTINGTWLFTTTNGIYSILQPVYLGSTDTPWQRLYVEDGTGGGIRIGGGPTNGGQNGLLYMDATGDLYWRNKSGTSIILDTGATDIQTFLTGFSTTWTKPPNAKWVQVICIGGGGGGSGGTLAAGSGAGPAGGGGGGAVTKEFFPASILGATETVTIGGGGPGGGSTATVGAGGAGTDGGISKFGTWTQAGGGGGGSGGVGGAGGFGGGGGGSLTGSTGRSGGLPQAVNNTDAFGNQAAVHSSSTGGNANNSEYGGASGDGSGNSGGSSIFAGAGGGAGANGQNTGTTAGAGGTVGAYSLGGGGAAGVNSGAAPGAGIAGKANSVLKKGYGGEGGGGGGGTASNGQIAANGGAGGFPGGGGGAGGSHNGGSGSGGHSGNGGNGGDGQVIVITFF